MAGLKLNGSGQAKMATLEECITLLQRVHSLVEQYALQIKRAQPGGHILATLRRTLPILQGKLKNQFGMISDQVMAVNLSTSRGASDIIRIRTYREGVAQIKQALDIAVTQTIEKHKEHAEPKGEGSAT